MNQTREPQSAPRDTHRMRRLLDRLRHLKAAHHARAQRHSWLQQVVQRLLRQGTRDSSS